MKKIKGAIDKTMAICTHCQEVVKSSGGTTNLQLEEQGGQQQVEPVQQLTEQVQQPAEVSQNTNMSYNNFKLELFQGDGTMNIDSYIKRFEQWQKCTKTSDEQALSALGWHLAGKARCWFEPLESLPETLGALKTVLIVKLKIEKTADMAIFSMKQQTGEWINDFQNRLDQRTIGPEIAHLRFGLA